MVKQAEGPRRAWCRAALQAIDSSRIAAIVGVVSAMLGVPSSAWAQYASLSGVVRDGQGAVIARASVQLIDEQTTVTQSTLSNEAGVYLFPAVKASSYRLEIGASGFATAKQTLTLHVDQRAVLDRVLDVAGQAEQVDVSATRPFLGTVDGSVGTTIDRAMAERLPTRARSFSALAELAPGVVRYGGAQSSASGSEFAVNGQRDTSNTLTVDGVSALSELGQAGLQNGSGYRAASTVTGTVNGGVSLDAVQEFRIQTSTFAAEFGRTPGAQISLVTRSGTNRYSGSGFEQHRSDALTANDFFSNRSGLPKPDTSEHQFGGTLGGPIVKSRSFFFASYEGLRLDRPRIRTATVPSVEARQQDSAIKALLNLYPVPTGPTAADMTAQHAQIYPQRYSADTWGFRADQTVAAGVQLFGRFGKTPSSSTADLPVPNDQALDQNTFTITTGMTAALTGRALLDVRANYGEARFSLVTTQDGLSSWFPANSPADATMTVGFDNLDALRAERSGNRQRQFNVVGSLSYLVGSHQLKAGLDYRHLHPEADRRYQLTANLPVLSQALSATSASLRAREDYAINAVYRNISLYLQDTWKVRSRLTATYGVRWDVNPPPTFGQGVGPLAATTFEPASAVTLSTTPDARLWRTNYGNVFPRFGASYALDAEAATVLSGGVGIFGDLEGAGVGTSNWSSALARTGVSLPLSAADVPAFSGPTFTPPYPGFAVYVVDPDLETPKTTQWNVALQRTVARNHVVSATYVGARGRNLLQVEVWDQTTNPSFGGEFYRIRTKGRSQYDALQIQYRGRLGPRLNVLASYNLSEALDTASANFGISSEGMATSQNDLRHMGNLAISWMLPTTGHRAIKWLVNDWSLDAIGLARSAYPFTVQTSTPPLPGQERVTVRASAVPGVPVKIDDPSAPGGWRYNRAAFADPPAGQQGDTVRNGYRGFSTRQVDLALQRSINVTTGVTLRVRVDVFNLFNEPVFGPPTGFLRSSLFGMSNGSPVSGLAQFYQPGGPRTVALGVRVVF